MLLPKEMAAAWAPHTRCIQRQGSWVAWYSSTIDWWCLKACISVKLSWHTISAALQADYGRPDKICLTPVSPIGGYQAAAQEVWVRGTDAISAIYRDTSLQAFEGCLFGVASGYCGLTGQLLVRISPADGIAEPDPCFFTNHRG